MAITDERVKKFEDEYKTSLFGMIDEFTVGQASLIQSLQTSAQYANINVELPNIGITLNNKIIELSHEFQNAGISMFSNKIENYGLLELDFVGPSLIGEALIDNLIGKVEEGTQVLEKYSIAFEEMLDKRKNKSQKLQSAGPIKRAFLKLRGWIMQFGSTDISCTKEETEHLNSFLSEYSAIDQGLWKYTIRDNIIPSLIEYIKDKYQEESIPELLQESVIPDLEKLGLADLIPELKQELERAFEEKQSSIGKLGELPPELKEKIQQRQQQTAKDYIEGLEISKNEAQSAIQEQE